MDENVGRLLDALMKLGLEENTVNDRRLMIAATIWDNDWETAYSHIAEREIMSRP